MLGKRIATAIIGIIAAFYIVNYGQWVFAAAVLALALLAWLEYCNMMFVREIEVSPHLGIISIILVWGTAWLGNSHETVAILVLATFMILARTVLAHAHFTLHGAVYTIAGVMYVGLSFAYLIMLRFLDGTFPIVTNLGSLPAGAAYVWLALVGTWASDTFAFFIGSKFGKHKLAPAISPGKTWEGAAGGVFGSVIGVVILASLFRLPLHHGAAIGLLVGLVAPLGDLVESSIKRYAGVKDSGRLLPGHGGVLDRFDSIMFVAPAVYYYVYIFIVG